MTKKECHGCIWCQKPRGEKRYWCTYPRYKEPLKRIEYCGWWANNQPINKRKIV